MRRVLWWLFLYPMVAWGEGVGSSDSLKTVITSKSARVLGKGQSVEFTGNVVLIRGDDYLSADRMVTEKDNSVARAWGRVFFRREGAVEPIRWEAWGDRGIYHTETSSGTLWGDRRVARAKRTPIGDANVSGGVVDIEAPEITLSRLLISTGTEGMSAGFAKARGGVYLKSVEMLLVPRVTELWAERADYDGPADRFQLEGVFPFARRGNRSDGPPAGLDRPYARQIQGREKRELRGEVIDLHPAAHRLVAERSVQADILYEQRGAAMGKKPPKKSKENSGVIAR